MTLIEELRLNFARYNTLPPEVIEYLKEKMRRVSKQTQSIKYQGIVGGDEGIWADAFSWDTNTLIKLVKKYFEEEGFTCTEEKETGDRDNYHFVEISWK